MESKNEQIKARKSLANGNIPKFDIGTMPDNISSGRLSTTTVDTSKFYATPGYSGFNTAAELYKQSVLPNVVSGIGNMASTATNLLSNYTSQTAANSTNIAAANAAGYTTAAGGAITNAADAELALEMGGKSVASAGLSTLGYATGIAGTAYGLYNMFQGAQNYKNRIHDTDMLNSSSITTLTKFGKAYKQYGGFDENGVLNQTLALNTADTTNMAISGASTGMAAGGVAGAAIGGAAAGTWAGPIGAGIGALLGILGGLFWGGSEARRRERLVKQDIKDTNEAIEGYNNESESEAGSAGLRDMYNATHRQSTTGILRADKGKNIPLFVNGKPVTFNPADSTSKKIQGKASPDETWLNTEAPLMEKVGYFGSPDPKVQDKRIDNVNLYGDIDPVRIAGHDEDAKINNKYIATLARPAGKEAERIKEEYKETTDPNKKAQLEDRMRFLDKKVGALLDILEDMQNRDNMKHQLNYKRMNGLRKFAEGKSIPRFDDAKTSNWFSKVGKFLGNNSDYLPAILGGIASLSNSNDYQNWINSQQPLMLPSSYVEAQDGSYLSALANMHEDPSAELAELNNVARLNRYLINQSANSAGQKAALSTSANNQLFSKRSQILADYAKRNMGYKQAWALAGIQSRQNAAQRAQQALSEQYKQYQQAVGAYNNLQANQYANKQTLYNSIAQALSTAKNTKGMMNLYNQQLANDAAAINTGKDTKGNTTSWTPTANRFLSPSIQFENWTKTQPWSSDYTYQQYSPFSINSLLNFKPSK